MCKIIYYVCDNDEMKQALNLVNNHSDKHNVIITAKNINLDNYKLENKVEIYDRFLTEEDYLNISKYCYEWYRVNLVNYYDKFEIYIEGYNRIIDLYKDIYIINKILNEEKPDKIFIGMEYKKIQDIFPTDLKINYYNIRETFSKINKIKLLRGKLKKNSLNQIIFKVTQSIQAKTKFIPNIVLNYTPRDISLEFKQHNKKNNILVIGSFHKNFAKVLLPIINNFKKENKIICISINKKVKEIFGEYNYESFLIQDFLKFNEILEKVYEKNKLLEKLEHKINSETFIINKVLLKEIKNRLINSFIENEIYFYVIDKLLSKNKIDLILLADDVEPIGRYVSLKAREYNITTINIQHGIIGDLFNYSSTISDFMFVWDEETKNKIDSNKSSSTRVITANSPKFFENKTIYEEEEINFCVKKYVNKIVLTWFPSPLGENITGENLNYLELKFILLNLKKLSLDNSVDLSLIIKVHPLEDRKKYENYLHEIDSEINVKILKNIDVNSILSITDIVVANNSTVILEAKILFNIYVISLNLFNSSRNMNLMKYWDLEINNDQLFIKTVHGFIEKNIGKLFKPKKANYLEDNLTPKIINIMENRKGN